MEKGLRRDDRGTHRGRCVVACHWLVACRCVVACRWLVATRLSGTGVSVSVKTLASEVEDGRARARSHPEMPPHVQVCLQAQLHRRVVTRRCVLSYPPVPMCLHAAVYAPVLMRLSAVVSLRARAHLRVETCLREERG